MRNWKRLQFPKVDVLYGDPLRFEVVADPTREQQQAAADQIFDEIKALYAQLEQHSPGGARRERAARATGRQRRRR